MRYRNLIVGVTLSILLVFIFYRYVMDTSNLGVTDYVLSGHTKSANYEQDATGDFDIEIPKSYRVTKDDIIAKGKSTLNVLGRENPMRLVGELLRAWDSKNEDGGSSILDMILPVDIAFFNISSPFGLRADPFTGDTSFHYGIDIANLHGEESILGKNVYAVVNGVVMTVDESPMLGKYVVLEHNGFRTLYGHLSKIPVNLFEGDKVKQGEVIGLVGSTGRSTGPHLHFEVVENGTAVNPLNYLVVSEYVSSEYVSEEEESWGSSVNFADDGDDDITFDESDFKFFTEDKIVFPDNFF